MRLCCERLERRDLLAVRGWLGTVGVDWTDPQNWTGGAVPGVDDTAEFSIQHSNLAVNIPPGTTTIRELEVDESYTATMYLLGTLELGNGGTFAGGVLHPADPGCSLYVLDGRFFYTGGTLFDAPVGSIVIGGATFRVFSDGNLHLGTDLYLAGNGPTDRALFFVDGGLTVDSGRYITIGVNAVWEEALEASEVYATPGVDTLPYILNQGTITVAYTSSLYTTFGIWNQGTILVDALGATSGTLAIDGYSKITQGYGIRQTQGSIVLGDAGTTPENYALIAAYGMHLSGGTLEVLSTVASVFLGDGLAGLADLRLSGTSQLIVYGNRLDLEANLLLGGMLTVTASGTASGQVRTLTGGSIAIQPGSTLDFEVLSPPSVGTKWTVLESLLGTLTGEFSTIYLDGGMMQTLVEEGKRFLVEYLGP